MPNAGTQQMQSALEKYQEFKPTQFPNFSQYESWLGADLMIKGIESAGSNPTHGERHPRLRNLKKLQRQWPPAGDTRLRNQLRARPQGMRVVSDRGEERIRPVVVSALVRYRHRWHDHRAVSHPCGSGELWALRRVTPPVVPTSTHTAELAADEAWPASVMHELGHHPLDVGMPLTRSKQGPGQLCATQDRSSPTARRAMVSCRSCQWP